LLFAAVAVSISRKCVLFVTEPNPLSNAPRCIVQAGTTLNATVSPALATSVETAWNSTLGKGGSLATWMNLVNETLVPDVSSILVWNTGILDCTDYDGCVGVTTDGECICYQS